MAKLPDDGAADAFIREVDEDLQRDRLLAWWNSYGRWLLGAIGVGLVALAAFLFWRESKREALEADSAAFQSALDLADQGEIKQALPKLEALAKDGSKGYKAFARLQLGALYARDGSPEKAAAALEALAKDENADPLLRDLAELRAVTLNFDKMKPEERIARLSPLAMPEKAWSTAARELLAFSYIQAGRNKEAEPVLKGLITSKDTPPALAERARLLLQSIGVTPPERPAAQDLPQGVTP